MIELTNELRQALSKHPDGPVQLVDTITQKTFILMTAEFYERLTTQFSAEMDPRVGMALMNRVMAEDDQDDPLLESYQPKTS